MKKKATKKERIRYTLNVAALAINTKRHLGCIVLCRLTVATIGKVVVGYLRMLLVREAHRVKQGPSYHVTIKRKLFLKRPKINWGVFLNLQLNWF